MELVKSENYGMHLCNFYEDEQNEMWLTREQVGAALGYADPAEAIKTIHKRHKERLDKFVKRERIQSAETSITHEGGQSDHGRENGLTTVRSQNKHLQSEVVYYSERGVMELCRWSDMPKADEFMDWVWSIVEAYRHNEIVANKKAIESLKVSLLEQVEKFNELSNTTSFLAERVEQLGKLVEDKNTETSSRLALLESKSEIMLDHDTKWAGEMMERIEKITETYGNVKREKITDRIIERAEEYLREPYKNYEMDYALHHNGKKGKKIFVMARDEDTRSAVEQAIKDFEIERGIFEQNEGQKYLETVLASMGETIVPDPPVPQHIMTDAELGSQWADMDKMYGEGWDKQPDVPSVEELYGG